MVEFAVGAPSHNGSVLVTLDFSSSAPCWFALQSDTPACSGSSPQFSLLPVQRIQSESKTTTLVPSSSSTATATTSLPVRTGATESSQGVPDTSRGGGLSTSAKAAIAITVGVASLLVAGMAGCFFFRRRKRLPEAVLAGHINDHGRGAGNGHEKTPLAGGSARSTGSTEALRVEPVYDGFPGSSGYDDVQSRVSSAYLCSPQSPGSSAGGFFPSARNRSSERQYSSEREELEAARLHSAPVPSGIVSYGPNPVTASITPRPSTATFHDNPSNSGSGDWLEEQRTSSTHGSISPQPQYLARPAAPPSVVSYGPNRITPTPVIASAAPDNSILKSPPDLPEFPMTGFPSYDASSTFDSMQYTPSDLVRHDPTTEPPTTAAPPLPPYASTAEFYAMEKGAIRKLREPAAQAELPPTKDGYYHFGDHGTEYELQGAAPQNEQLHPHQPYRNQTAGLGRAREVDEQKFLLDDAEMEYLKAQKARIRAARQEGGETFEMQPKRTLGNQAQDGRS